MNEIPRLRAMGLPNGKFLLVLDRCPGDPVEAGDALREAVPDAYAIASRYTVEVQDWPSDDLATAAAEACAMTHGEEDAALIGQVRGAFAGLHAEAEAWRMQGRPAVEAADALRMRAERAEVELVALRVEAEQLLDKLDGWDLGEPIHAATRPLRSLLLAVKDAA